MPYIRCPGLLPPWITELNTTSFRADNSSPLVSTGACKCIMCVESPSWVVIVGEWDPWLELLQISQAFLSWREKIMCLKHVTHLLYQLVPARTRASAF